MSEYDNPDFFDPVDEINKILSDDRQALPSVYKKVEKLDVVGEGSALVASANEKTLPSRRVGRFEMLEVLERSLGRTVLNIANPGQRVFTAIRELSDFVNMATTGAQPKIANAHRDLLPVGHPLSTKQHNFSTEEVAQARADWMSADPRISEAFRPLVASAFVAPASSLEREYVIAKLEATNANEVPRDIILSLTAGVDPYGGGNSFLARSTRAKAQRRDRRGRFAWMGGGARVWLGKQFSARSTLFRFAGYNSQNDSFDLEGVPGSPYFGKVVSVPASKVEAIKAILPELPGLKAPASKSVAKDIIVDPDSLELKDAPTGWTKVSSENGVDTFRSADGWIATRYPNSASAPNEPSITRVRGANSDKSINPDLPVYHIAKGSNDGLVTDKPFALTQGWGDAQALISRYDKKTDPKPKATLEEQPEEFLEGWAKDERGYIPADYNPYGYYEGRRDPAIGNATYTDPSGRFVAVSMAPKTLETLPRGVDAEAYKRRQESDKENIRKYVAESGKPVSTFDGAQKWDGDVSNLWRLEKVRSDGKKEIVGYYQDLDDIERDTEIPKDLEQGKDFYEEVIANTLQYGGNSVDFVDGSNPEQGYLVAHEADVLKQDGTIGKREQLVSPKDFMDPVDGPKILRDYVLKNQEKLMEKGFYLGTWTDTVDVKDANGKVTGQREMVFLDVSEYVEQFDDAIDAAEKRGEIAIYGAAEGKSYYTADEMKRREVIRSTPKFDEERANEVRKKADEIIDEEDKWFRDNRSVWENFERDNRISLWSDTDGNWESPSPVNLGRSEPIPNPEVAKISPEIYGHLKRRFDADKSRNSVFQEYIRSVFEMPDGMDPGSRFFGLDDKQDLLDIRNRYVGDDDATLKMNAKLREGEDATSRVKSTDRLINKSKFKQDTLLYRGAWLSPELVDEMGIGDSFFDRGFQSAGLDVDTANGYLDFRAEKSQGKKRVVLRVLAPKGMNAIHVGDDEVIMRRNTKMTIVRKTELNGTTYIDVDTEPQTKEEINARIQGRVPRPEPSESSSELPGDDGGGTDGLGDGGTPPVNYSPESTVEGPEQATRVADPNTAIWGSLSNDVAGVSQSEIIDEAIAMKTTPDRLMSQVLKANVAKSLTEKLKDLDNEEFLKMAVSLKMYFEEDLYWDDESLKDIDTIPVIFRDKFNDRAGQTTYSSNIQGLVTSRPMGGILPQDLIDRLNTGEISRKDAEDVVRLMNESGKFENLGKIIFVNKDSKDYMGILRESVVSNLVAQWASTSNGGDPMSLAIQDLAMKEFDIDRPAEWKVEEELKDEISEIKNNHEKLIKKFLRAQYDLTQEYFQKKGISKITLYRGVRDFTAHDMTKSTFPSSRGFTAAIKLRPMSSWSTSEGIAFAFGIGADSKIFRKEYDVKNIVAFPGTGVGCYDEREMVVLGGVTNDVDIADPRDIYNIAYNSPEPAPITYKEDQVSQEPDLPVNNAPAEEETFKDFTPIDTKPYLQKREEIRKEVTKARKEAEEFQKSIDSGAMLSLAKKTKDGSYIANENIIEYYGKNGKAMYAKVDKWLKLYDKLSDFDKKFLDSMFDRDSKAEDPGKDKDVFLWGISNHTRRSWYSSGEAKFNEAGKQEWQQQAFVGASRLISKSSLKTDAELYRGEWLPKDLVESVAVGDTIYFDNIQELSYLPNVPKRQLDGTKPRYKSSYLGEPKATSIKLNCPKGINALYLGDQAYDWENQSSSGDGSRANYDQAMTRAVLLRPDVKMKLVSKTEKDGVIQLEFDVEPKTKEEIDNNISGLVKQGDEESAFQPEIPVNNAPDTYIPTGTDDGGIEPDPDFFELEGVDVYSPEIYKREVSINLADSPEMQEVSDSEMIKLSEWFGILRSDELEWGENEEKFIDNIRLLEINDGQWTNDYEFTDILYNIEQNMKAGGVEPFKEGSVLKRVVESYIDRENGVISEADLAQFFEDYNEHFDVDYADSYLVPDIKDPEFARMLREQICSNLVHQWAQTANNNHPMSHAIQDTVEEVFGIKDAPKWKFEESVTYLGENRGDSVVRQVEDIKKENSEFLNAFVKAQYRLTQEWFEERGIDKISVYRGINDVQSTVSGSGMAELRPLSSWTTDLSTAEDFTRGNPSAESMLLRREVDVKEIFSTPLTGVGCIQEYEVVLLGGKKVVDSAQPSEIKWGEWPKTQPELPVNNAPILNFAPKGGKGGLSKEIERRQKQLKQQQEEYAKRLEEQEKAKENIKGQVESNKEELERQIPQIAQSLPATIDDLFDPNHPLNVLNSRDITQEVFGVAGSSDIRRPRNVSVLEPDQNWKDLIKNLESLGLADAQDIENEVKNKFDGDIRVIQAKRKIASKSRKKLEDALVDVEKTLKTIEDELIIKNFGLNTPGLNAPNARAVADIGVRISEFKSWAEEYYYQKTGQALDADNLASPLRQLISLFHSNSPEIMEGAISQLNEIGKLQDSRERQKGYDRVVAKIVVGSYMTQGFRPYTKRLDELEKSAAVPVMLGRKFPEKWTKSLKDKLDNERAKYDRDSRELGNANQVLSNKVSKIIKEKLEELGVVFEHDVEILPSEINYLGTGKIKTGELVAGKPKSEWWEPSNKNIGSHLSDAKSYASILTDALQAFPKPVAMILKKFIAEHPEIMFGGAERGSWFSTPKDRNIDKVQHIEPKDLHMSLMLHGATREDSVNTASHELTHMLTSVILPQLQAVEWATLSSFLNQYDANGNIKHDLVNGNAGDTLIGGEISTTYANDAILLASSSEAAVYTPKMNTPYSSKYQLFASVPAMPVKAIRGLMPYGQGELLSTLGESMFNGSTQVFYGQRIINPGDTLRIGYNADGTPKYFTIPDSPIFNAGALPIGIAISLLMNQLAKDKLGVI